MGVLSNTWKGTKPMNKLINTYMQGEAVITQYETGNGLIDLDGTPYVEVETYKDGVWCDTQLVQG